MARPSMTICRLTKYATDNTFLCILWWQWPCVCDVSYFYMITIVGYYYVCFIYKLMRFHCCHSVRRVLAKEPTEANDIKLEYLSIPVNSSYLFQMVKTRTQCKDNQSFRQIFKKIDASIRSCHPTTLPYLAYLCFYPLVSDPMTMSEILEKKEFPILIQFSTEQIIPDEGKNRDGSPASFLIIASHEEHFIQGNYLLNGTETLT